MHAASYNLMSKLRAHVPAGAKVLDVGGADVNGSYRPLFDDCTYTSLDFKNADINVTGYDWPIDEGAFDAVISGQCFEHDPMFWLSMKNIARVLRVGGVAILIVPSTGPVHRHPVDCWRFNPDCMKALANWSGLSLIGTDRSDGGAWKDIAGVFRK